MPGITNAPSGLYPCKPGGSNDWVYIMTSRGNPEHWSRLMTLLGHEEMINDPRYLTPADRVKHEAEIDAVITDWTLRHTKYEAMNLVGSVGVPAGAVLDTMELQNDQTFVERGIMQTVEHPKLGSLQDADLAGAHRRQAAAAASGRRSWASTPARCW